MVLLYYCIIVMEALFRIFKTWCPWELLYADDLVISVESIEEFRVEILDLEISSRKYGLTVNLQKTKIMHCKYHDKKDTRKFPCGVYRSGVGRNSIFPTLAIQIFLPQGEKVFQREMLFLICVSIMAICAGKNMLMQH